MIIIYPQWGKNVCTKCHDNPFNTFKSFHLKTQKVNFMVAQEEKVSRALKSVGFSPWEPLMSKFHSNPSSCWDISAWTKVVDWLKEWIHSVDVEISRYKWNLLVGLEEKSVSPKSLRLIISSRAHWHGWNLISIKNFKCKCPSKTIPLIVFT